MIRIIIGLGNPGSRYKATRHNIGFDILDSMAYDLPSRFRKSWRCSAWLAKAPLEDTVVYLAKPTTFMNRSGKAVKSVMKKYRLNADQIVVVYDDLALDLGKIRIRPRGSAGGHNGMASIIEALGTDDFPRLRVGIGPRPGGEEQIDFVLGTWPAREQEQVSEIRRRSVEALTHLVGQGVESTMNNFNG
jgi:PTH1 family peptidyl-tRNA hydrolase